MNKLIPLLLLLSMPALAEDKFLEYQYTPTVKIKISNIPCPLKKIAKEYPFAAVAFRIDGTRMVGCYLVDTDEVAIMWSSGELRAFPVDKFHPFKPEL
jgi:hypothetical protein